MSNEPLNDRVPELESRYERLQNISDRLADLEGNLSEFQKKMGPPSQEGTEGEPKDEPNPRTDFIYRLDSLSDRMEAQLNRLHSVMSDLRRML